MYAMTLTHVNDDCDVADIEDNGPWPTERPVGRQYLILLFVSSAREAPAQDSQVCLQLRRHSARMLPRERRKRSVHW